MTDESQSVTPAEIGAAYGRIRQHVRRTPLVRLAAGSFGLDYPLSLKLEQLQLSGSFKVRGAFNNLLSRPVPQAGIAAASGGNHGAAVAAAARALGHPATIFVPEISAPAKVARIEAAGARVVQEGQRYADALERCEAFQTASGAIGVHAYDAVETIAGQGTLALEWEQQAPELDTLLVAVGGGGLIGGIAAWFQGAKRVVGVEPEGAPSLHAALAAGGPVETEVETVAADSLGPRQLGSLPYAIASRHVATSVLVEDASIRAAQRLLWRDLQVVAEPGGATALAALISGAYRPAPRERIGVLVCGANCDPASVTQE